MMYNSGHWQLPILSSDGIAVILNSGWKMWHLKAALVHPKLVCLALTVAVCIIFWIAVLAVLTVLFVQSNHIMIAYLSEIVDHDHSFAEISITPPALVHPAITNIAATTVVLLSPCIQV